MYEWHAKHPTQGRRFGEAMESVSRSECESPKTKIVRGLTATSRP